MRIFFLSTLFAFLLLSEVSAKIEVTSLKSAQIPSQVKFKKNLEYAYKWKDLNGLNFLVLSLGNKYRPKEAVEMRKKFTLQRYESFTDTIYESYVADFINQDLYATHYIYKNSKYLKKNTLYDFVNQCPDAMTLEFITSPKITDLDNDNIAEIWILYSYGCRSDVSPIDMKLILFYKNKKYTVSGTRLIKYGEPTEKAGGEKHFDKNFKKLDFVFKKYANNLWLKYNEEHLE